MMKIFENVEKFSRIDEKQNRNIEEELLPYAGLKTLIIERDTGVSKPEFRSVLVKTVINK